MQSVIAFNVKLYKFSKFKSVDTRINPLEKFFDVIQYNLMIEEPNTEYIDVTKIFTQWTKQRRFPVLKVQRVPLLNEVNVHVVEPSHENLSIYVTYITQENPDITYEVWLQQPLLYLYDINSSDWIIINVQQAGEYKSINICFYVYHVNKVLRTVAYLIMKFVHYIRQDIIVLITITIFGKNLETI